MLKLISYLAPSIPSGLYESVAALMREQLGLEIELQFEQRISGPLPGDENPFAMGKADLGFVCSPTYRNFSATLELMPSLVPTDHRSGGKTIYFSDIVVATGSRVGSLAELRGSSLAYNDQNSHSGWFSILDHIRPEVPDDYFSNIVHSGSHINSLMCILDNRADVAGVDSNALRYFMANNTAAPLTVIGTLGPFPIQPVVVRSDLDETTREAVRQVLLDMHLSYGETLNGFGFERFAETEPGQYLNQGMVFTRPVFSP